MSHKAIVWIVVTWAGTVSLSWNVPLWLDQHLEAIFAKLVYHFSIGAWTGRLLGILICVSFRSHNDGRGIPWLCQLNMRLVSARSQILLTGNVS